MTKLVFSEGGNDVLFLKEVHLNAGKGHRYDTFVSKETDDVQTRWLGRQTADDRFDYLYKSEGGYGELIKKFRSFALAYTKFSIRIMADLDGDSFSSLLEDFNTKLHESYSSKVRIELESKNSLSHITVADTTLRIEGSQNRELPLIAFHQDLEDATGIIRADSTTRKRQKIRSYIQDNPKVIAAIENSIY